ncbi:hypothetical protein EVAR_4094_1 [Eumeta japonica]|uniref:Uncharacterized protein n=1 Tax=Eumeta variegata TaxID=151549 RepID=A0A4C1T6R2_EUMVA|nr:hypothetical protein EVAR_4094_1 [Eumeta japonica]
METGRVASQGAKQSSSGSDRRQACLQTSPLSVHGYRRGKAIWRRDRTRQPLITPQLVLPLESVKKTARNFFVRIVSSLVSITEIVDMSCLRSCTVSDWFEFDVGWRLRGPAVAQA